MIKIEINNRLYLEKRQLGFVLIHTAEDGKTQSVIPLTETDAKNIYEKLTGRVILSSN